MSKPLALAAGLGLALAASVGASAEEVKVYAAGAAQHVVLETKAAFERASGHALVLTFGTDGCGGLCRVPAFVRWTCQISGLRLRRTLRLGAAVRR